MIDLAARRAFLKGLDWTRPAADLYDEVVDFLWENEPRIGGRSYEEIADLADRITLARLK
jgi:hypothetical protein